MFSLIQTRRGTVANIARGVVILAMVKWLSPPSAIAQSPTAGNHSEVPQPLVVETPWQFHGNGTNQNADAIMPWSDRTSAIAHDTNNQGVTDSEGETWSYLSDGEFQPLHCRTCDLQEQRWGFNRRPFQLGGWIQQGVTLNPDSPRNHSNAPVLFNDRSNDYQLNQFYVYAGKQVQVDGTGWDWGARVDLNYGTDSRFVTVPGLEKHNDRTRKWNSETSKFGLAMPQAYLDIATPLGPYGSTFRAGHFYALGGYETFAAPDNFFYSHSYTYVYGEPFTHSGGMWHAKLTPTLSVAVAATTGWDSFYNELDGWGTRFGIVKELNEGQTTIALTAHTGDDFTGITTSQGTSYDSRTWASIVLKHYLNTKLYYVFQGDYGRQEQAVIKLDNSNNTIAFDAGQWWGLNQYLVYQISHQWSSGMRVEWFRDDGNSRVGVPIEYVNSGPAFLGSDYYAITGGVNYKPHPNVLFRNEIRWDGSDVQSNASVPGGIAGIRPFDDRSDQDQLTIAMDLIVLF